MLLHPMLWSFQHVLPKQKSNNPKKRNPMHLPTMLTGKDGNTSNLMMDYV